MNRILYYLAGITLISALACKSDVKKADDGEATSKTSGQLTQRYGIKSGTVVYNAPMGMKQTLYFDDFGKREVMISEMAMAGMSFKDIEIRRDGFTYKYKEGEKTGTKIRWNIQNQNYENFDPELVKQFKLKDLGSEEIAGKKCKKYSMEVGSNPVYAWIWKGISVKTVTHMAGNEFVIEAIKIDEGSVPAGIFEIPTDVAFTEIN
jgi:hypothetical protein